MKTKKKQRVHYTHIEFNDAEVSLGWGSSTLTLKEYVNAEVSKRVTLVIDRPSTVAYLREQLDKIVASWESDLKSIRNIP